MSEYARRREALLNKLSVLRIPTDNYISELTKQYENRKKNEKMACAQAAKDVDLSVRKYFNEICSHMIWIPTFKETVFELLEEYHFEKCASFIQLLDKWKVSSKLQAQPPLSVFFKNTEPKSNKMPFYKAAFDNLTDINLAEFLAVSIGDGELSEDFIFSLENARPF